MPGLLVESNVGAVWAAKQTAKGSAATAAGKKYRMVGGSMPQTNTALGSENYMDGNRFQNSQDFVDTIQGQGAPALQVQSGTLAHLLWLFCGSEGVTGSGPFVHTITPGSASFWSTWWKSLGATTVMREQFRDCRLSQLVVEGSTGSKILRATPTIMSLDPGYIANVDPVKVDDGTSSMNYNQAQGAFLIDGVAISGHSAFTITLTDDLNPYRGDSPYAMALAPGRGQMTIAATILLDDQGLAQFYKLYYGATNPSSGSRPATSLPALGAYRATFTQSSGEIVDLFFQGVRWSPPDAPDGSPDGGAITLALNGGGRILASNPMLSAVITNGDAAYTI